MRKTANNILYNTAYQIFLVIVPIITAPYLSRILGPENMGKYSFVETVINIFTNIGLIGLYNYGIREIAYVRDKGKSKLSKSFFEIMITRILMLMITSLLYFLYMQSTKYGMYLMFAYIWLVGNFLDPTFLFNGMEDFKLVTIRNFIIKFISIISIFVLVKSKSDLYKYFLIVGVCQIFAGAVVIPSLKKYIVPVNISKLKIKRHILPSLQVFMPQIATLVYTQVDKLMIEALTNNVAFVTYYDNAEKIVKVPLSVITSINLVLMPNNANLFINGKISELKKYIQSSISATLFISLPMAFGIASIGFTLIPWYLGEDYIKAGYLIAWLAPIIIALALSGISANQFYIATKKTSILTKIYIASAITNIVINFLLIPPFGCYGAAIGTLSAEFLSVFAQYFMMKKDIDILKPLSKSIRYLVFSMFMCAISIVIGLSMGSKITTTLIQIIVSIFIYCLCVIIFRDEQTDMAMNSLKEVKNKLLGNRRKKKN